MTKKELLEKLEPFPDDMPVIVMHDAEGNGASELSSVSEDICEIPQWDRPSVRAVKQAIILWPM